MFITFLKTLNPSCGESVLSHYCTGDLDVNVNSNMSRNRSKDVPEGIGLVPHHDELRSGEPTMADLHRMLEENFDRSLKNKTRSHFDRQDKTFGELTETIIATNQRLADPQHQAHQPRLATEAAVEI